jgi:hypothetical protein
VGPVVAKVITIEQAGALAREGFRQLDRAVLDDFSRQIVIGVGHPIALAADFELMQMVVLPSHCSLKNLVKLGERSLTRHFYPPPDGRGDVEQGDVQTIEGHISSKDQAAGATMR